MIYGKLWGEFQNLKTDHAFVAYLGVESKTSDDLRRVDTSVCVNQLCFDV